MSKEPELEHHVIADLAARLAKAERALEEAEKVIALFAGDKMPVLRRTKIAFDQYGLHRLMSPMEIAMLAARKWMEERHG